MKFSSFAETGDAARLSGAPAPRRNLRSWTIRRRVVAGFATVTLLALLQAVVGVLSLLRIDAGAAALAEDSLPGMLALAQIQRNAGDIQVQVLRDLLPRTDEESARFQAEIEELRLQNERLMKEYAKRIHSEKEKAIFAEMVAARDAYAAVRSRVLALSAEGRQDEARALNTAELRPAFNTFQEALDRDMEYCMTAAGESSGRVRAASTLAVRFLGGAAVLAVVLSIITAVVLVVTLSRILARVAGALKEGANQVASAAAEVSASSQTLAEGASQQAASLEETSSSLEEMSSMTKRNSESAGRANSLVREARQMADAGATDMRAMSAAMDAIKASGDDVAKIVKTIDEIAFQTNILALNAAVEAARAGSAGAGFAVVADEVRALAQRSAVAAKETAAKIDGSLTRTREGVGVSRKVEANLVQIVDKVRQVDQLIAEVSTGSDEQSRGVQQISSAVTQMDKVVQSTAGSAEETAAAAEELSGQAGSMRESVSELMRLVNGQAEQAAAQVERPREREEVREQRTPKLRPVLGGRSPTTADVSDLHFRNA